MFTFPFDDFISPVAGLLFCFAAVSLLFSDVDQKKITYVGILGGLGTLVLDPPSARFFLPYYPSVIISALFLVKKFPVSLRSIILWILLLSGVVVLLLRISAFQKNIPFLLGKQTANQYLTALSSRLPDTFIDSDDFVKDNLKDEKIIIDNLHNLYYFPHRFDHTSWTQGTKGYNYLVTKNQDPKQIDGTLLHTNNVGIQVFKLRQ